MEANLSEIIVNVSALSAGFPFLVGLLKYRRLNQLQVRVFSLVCLSVFFELLATYSSLIPGFEAFNLPLLHTFTFIHYLMILWVYQQHLANLFRPKLVPILAAVFLVMVVVNGIWGDGFTNFNPHARALQALLVLFFVLSYFYRTLREMKITQLERDPLFWVSTGLLLYFSGSLLIFIVSNSITTSPAIMFTVWGIHSLLNILLNIFLAISLWVRPVAD